MVFIQAKKTFRVNKTVLLFSLMILLVFPAYLFQADAQLPGSMSTQIHEDVVVLNTKQGKMVIQLFSADAP